MAIGKDGVVEAATRVIDRDGWERLSLRSTAAELGVTPMALYRHVDDAQSLRRLVVDTVVASAPPAPRTDDVIADLTAWAIAFRETLGRHDGVAGFVLGHWFESEATRGVVEDLLALADRHGVAGFESVALTNAVFTYVLMRCEVERRIRADGTETRPVDECDLSGAPILSSLVEHYAVAQFDVHFEFGLAALIRGALHTIAETS